MNWVEPSAAVASAGLVAVLVAAINQSLVDELAPEVEVVIQELVSLAAVVDSSVALGFDWRWRVQWRTKEVLWDVASSGRPVLREERHRTASLLREL